VQGEVDVSHTHLHQALHLVLGVALGCVRERIAKYGESFSCDFRQQGLFVFEVTVGSGYADSRQVGRIAQGQALHAVLVDEGKRGGHQGCPQVSVMIGALGFQGQGSLLVLFYINVNRINIYVNLFYMRHRFSVLFAAAPGLTILGFIMAADLVLACGGLVVDRQVITGAPAWLKPAKFALSTMIAAWSFAFCIASTRIWPRVTRALDVALTVGLAIEIALIDMQAARGTTSHFNVATPFDGAVFAVMGVSILCIWLAMLLLTVVLFRQPYASPAWGWALRLGMVLALIGTGSGGLMAMPNSQQLAEAHVSGRLPIAGAHTVGAADGGPGLPVTRWSADHGDLRVAHFLGMHGLQVLPLLAWWVARRRFAADERTQRNLIFAVAASYLALFGLILWQAFRGQSIAQPDSLSWASFAAWLVLTAVAVIAIRGKKGIL
jgi:hypothetical protein